MLNGKDCEVILCGYEFRWHGFHLNQTGCTLNNVRHANLPTMEGTSPSAGHRESPQAVGIAEATDSLFIAIIGMACRFPGAPDISTFWANLANGVESLARLSAIDEFDAGFFGYTDGEALLIEPQHRIFLEVCWAALEDAGYDPTGYRDVIGVYAGCSETAYADALRSHQQRLAFASDRQIRLATDVHFFASRAAYKLGLRGPAVTVLTACSTSLVAIHMAGNALLGGDCDIALAGGVTAHLWRDAGKDDGEGLISPDGHCRAFDAKAAGTVFTDGAGVLVLKRLADAQRDGDNIRAVIRGSAVNNDGLAKVGFLAPSIEAQARVIKEAQFAAGVGPETIGFVEAHGTGTRLGDPIEIAALNEAFRFGTDKVGYCPIGTVKTNIGHTDAAAGSAGVIKVALAMEHHLLPASLNFDTPNPEIDFDGSPFVVLTEPSPWPEDRGPRRAGVSAFGLGGTNAHLVLEEPPSAIDSAASAFRPWHLLVTSARDKIALDTVTARLAGYFREHQDIDLASVEWTLQTGRKAHAYRRYAVCADPSEAVAILTEPAAVEPDRAIARPVAFAFPGLGGQHVGMGRELYAHEPEFRAWIGECAELARPQLGIDLRTVLFSYDDNLAGARDALADTSISQPAVFMLEYALARLLLSWGITPDVLVGHSLGAYAAACVAGVFSLPDALALVAMRGRLLGEILAGTMLAVSRPDAEVAAWLTDELEISVVNSPAQCVVAGPRAAVADLQARLEEMGVDARLLKVPVPAHSRYVEPIMSRFEELVRAVPRHRPDIPVISELTGSILSSDEITDPVYWASHLRRTVRFGDALGSIFERPEHAIFEVGPSQALTTIIRRHPDRPAGLCALPTMPHPYDGTPELAVLLSAVGQFWSAGGAVCWAGLHEGRQPRRVPLPGYPFQRRRYRVDPPVRFAAAGSVAVTETADKATEPVLSAELPSAELLSASDDTRADLGQTYHLVADAFCQVLGVSRVDPHDSFFALGGDSMMSAQLIRLARHTFGLPIALRGVFENPTVAGLAHHVETLRRQHPPASKDEVRQGTDGL